MSEPISEREELARILAENGATSPDGIHSWRCAYFEWYGPCGCVDELLDDLAARDARIRADIAAEVLADGIEECADLLAPFSGIGMGSQPTRVEVSQWLLNRAEAIRALSAANDNGATSPHETAPNAAQGNLAPYRTTSGIPLERLESFSGDWPTSGVLLDEHFRALPPGRYYKLQSQWLPMDTPATSQAKETP